MSNGLSLFGVGPDGIPEMFATQLREPGGGERLAAVITEGARGRMVAPDFLRVAAQVLVEHYGRQPQPTPDFVFEANAAALRLLSDVTMEPCPAPSVRRLLGYPTSVDLHQTLDAAGRDAWAIALRLIPDDDSLPLDAAIGHEWVLSQSAIDRMTGIPRTSVTSHREKYRTIVDAIAPWLLLGLCLSPQRAKAGMSEKAIENVVSRVPREDILALVGGFNLTAPRVVGKGSLLDIDPNG